MTEYFSEKEKGKVPLTTEEISIKVWNAIVSIFEKYKAKQVFSQNFPETCPEGQVICGFNKQSFEDRVRGEIPNLKMPIRIIKTYQEKQDKYAVLDFIEFCYKNISDPIELRCNSRHIDFHQHNHYSFKDDRENKLLFIEDINKIFERNGIVFYLKNDGQIKRAIDSGMEKIIKDITFKTSDKKLNELLEEAYLIFTKPKIESRIEAIKKIWDAFERLKTYYENKDKKDSVEELIKNISKENKAFQKELNTEFKKLTEIGNSFGIRHSERWQKELKEPEHIDYIFYRMASLIHLCLNELK